MESKYEDLRDPFFYLEYQTYRVGMHVMTEFFKLNIILNPNQNEFSSSSPEGPLKVTVLNYMKC